MLLVSMRPPRRFGSLIYETYEGEAAGNALGGYLMRSPYANAEALAALADGAQDGGRVSGIGFYRERALVGAMVSTPQVNYLSPMQPEVQQDVLDFIETDFIGHAAGPSGGGRLAFHLNAVQTGSVTGMWNSKATRTVPFAKQHQVYHLYNDMFVPSLPASRFDGGVRRATPDEQLEIMAAMADQPVEVIKTIPEDNLKKASAALTRNGLHVLAGEGLLRLSAFYLHPVSETGCLVKPSVLFLNDAQAAPRADMLDEMTEQFAAIASHAEKQGRWAMFGTAPGGPVPGQEVAERLGLMDAGAVDYAVLGVLPKVKAPAAV